MTTGVLKAQIDSLLVQLSNPSFEDIPQVSRPPRGWFNCGFPGESPSDIHPTKSFGVIKSAAEGETYVGMVTRDNATWEGIGQHLNNQVLYKGQTYVIQLKLAQSAQYVSVKRDDIYKEVNYHGPVVLRIWGGKDVCERTELLAVSPPIEHSDWRMYQLSFTPQTNLYFILIEAYYNSRDETVSNGNLLVDDLSHIIPIEYGKVLFSHYKIKMDNTYWQQYEHPLPFATPAVTNNSYTSPSIIYPTLKLPVAKSLRALKGLIRSDGPYVTFDRKKTRLNTEEYYVEQQLFEQNFNLHRLANAVQSLKGYKMVLSVNGRKEKIINKRIFHLTQAFFDFGLTEEDFAFVPWPRPFNPADWDSVGLEKDVLIRIEPQ